MNTLPPAVLASGFALLAVLGHELHEAMVLIEEKRPVVDFADVYVRSVHNFLRKYTARPVASRKS